MTPEMWFVVAMIAIPLLQVMFNRWRVDVAALFVIVALGLAQYLGFSILGNERSSQQTLLAISGFSQPVVVTLIGLFILTQTLSHNGVMLWLGQRLAAMGGSSEARLIFLFAFTSASLSLLMNNVAVGALLLPSAIQVAKKSKVAPSKLLIPISFGTALGGMATYFTTANIVFSNLLSAAAPPQIPLGVLSFLPVGGLVALAGILYLTITGRRVLPDRQPGPEQAIARRAVDELEVLYSLGERIWEATVTMESSFLGKTLRQTRIGERYGLAVIGIRRGRGVIAAPDPTVEIEGRDVLLIVGRKERVDELSQFGIEISQELQTLTIFNLAFLELILAPHSAYAGKTLKQMNFRRKYGFMVIALLRNGRSYRTDVGDMRLEMGDALLLVGPSARTRDLRINPDVVILETDPTPHAIPRKRALASIAVFISAIVMSIVGVPVYLSVLAAALFAILLQLLPLQEVYRSIEWQVVFFIAGMYVASLGMIHTGLANLIGLDVIDVIEKAGVGPLGLAASAFLLSCLLTQFMGSQATAFVVGPIAISAAITLNTNPQAIAVAAAIGCSASFLTPMAHPVNLLMMGPGNYRFGDFFRVGAGLTLVVFLALLLGMFLFWRL